jgi:hypothetical protein
VEHDKSHGYLISVITEHPNQERKNQDMDKKRRTRIKSGGKQ